MQKQKRRKPQKIQCALYPGEWIIFQIHGANAFHAQTRAVEGSPQSIWCKVAKVAGHIEQLRVTPTEPELPAIKIWHTDDQLAAWFQ